MYRKVLDRGWPVFALLFLAGGGFCLWQLFPRAGHDGLVVDAGTNMLLNESDPDLHYYNQTRADWDYDEYTIVCLHRKEWFTPEGVQLLNEFTESLKGLPHFDKYTAINNVPLLRLKKPGTAFGQPVPSIVRLSDKDFDPAKLPEAEDEIRNHTQALRNLIHGDNVSVLVYLQVSDQIRRLEPLWNYLHGRPDDPEAKKQIEAIRGEYQAALKELRIHRNAQVQALRELCRRWQPRFDEPIRLSGLPIISVNMVEHVQADLRSFGLAAAGMFVLGFLVLFRKIRWTALPILTCLLPVLLILGSMTMMGRRLTVITCNMPALLFVLLLPYTVYFVERYRERRARAPEEPQADSVAGSARDIWIPCLYSATTTMAGTASLLTSGISPVRTFGLLMTIGMAVGLMSVFLFLPSTTRPLRPLVTTEPKRTGPLTLLAGLPLRAPLCVLLASLAVLGVAIWGTTKIDVENKFIDYFRKESEVYAGLEYIDTRMGGTTPMEIMLRSDEKGFFKKPEGFAAMRAVHEFFDRTPETGNVRSLATLVDEVKKFPPHWKTKAWSDQDALVRVQVFARDMIREYCDKDYTVCRVLVRMKETYPGLNRKRILAQLREHLETHPATKDLKEKRPTGVFILYSNMLQSLIRSQKDTFLMVLGAIFLMLVILFRNPLLAAIVLLPQVLPVFVVLGVMGFAKIPLDMVTTMIASVAMGVGIDPAIQYAVRFRRELAAGGERDEVVRRAHLSIGRAIAMAGIIVTAGFSVLVLSKFVPTIYFGLFTGLAVLIGIVASLTTLPAMFVLFRYPRR